MGLLDYFRKRQAGTPAPGPVTTDRQAEAERCIGRGNLAEDAGRLDEALANYDEAIELAPMLARAHLNRGNALFASHKMDAAMAAYQTARTLDPGYAGAHCNFGNAAMLARRPELALAAYESALAVDPRLLAAQIGRSNVLDDLGRSDEAISGYRRALDLAPGSADVLTNLGLLYSRLKRYPEAADCFAQALASAPGRPYLAGNLFSARIYACDWRHYRQDVEALHAAVDGGRRDVAPFIFLIAARTAQAQLRCAQLYCEDKYPVPSGGTIDARYHAHRRIRVAYVSADFHSHATAALMAGLFECHDRGRFEIFAISFGPDDGSAMRARLVKAFDHFVDVRHSSDEEIAVRLRSLEIDIAIDLKGYTAQARPGIFAHRAAPIQVNYLGFPGTLGSPFIDYIIADDWVAPPEHADCFSEKIVALPGSYQVNDARRVISTRAPNRAEVGLPDDAFVFCSFNNNYKITPSVFDVWMRLLGQCPGSVLWLLEDNPHALSNLRAEAEIRGIGADRLVFAPRRDLPDHLARHRLADLFLDTLPCNAHTTASDSLWAGLPLLTCIGDTFAGRVAASLLAAVGLPQLIARSLAEYEAIALELARNRESLARLREHLQLHAATSALFDTDRFRRRLESALLQMHERHLRGEQPGAFSVVDP